MAIEVVIIVADAPPLITLAAAHSLDYLLYPALPVIIPDAVFHEAMQAAKKFWTGIVRTRKRCGSNRLRFSRTK
jgi:hypothetical protein